MEEILSVVVLAKQSIKQIDLPYINTMDGKAILDQLPSKTI